MRKPRPLLAATAALAALGATTAALADSGGTASAARSASASASAYSRVDADGTRHGYVSVTGDESRSASGTSATSSTAGGKGRASASASVRGVSIFNGLVTARSVSVRASASGGGAAQGGSVRGLAINGHSRGNLSSRRVLNMGGYGKLVVLDSTGRGIIGLRAKLTRSYHGQPAGATVRVGYAAAAAQDATAPPKPKPSKPKPHHSHAPTATTPHPAAPKPHKRAKRKHHKASRVHTLLTGKGYVFPIYGKHEFTDTFGAARADTGFHEGDDLFASAGTPVVAVCDGSLNRVGTLPISGNRLWVKCTKGGDSFFYCHLSSFAAGAHGGVQVKAGQVVGFVGSTGDAEQTPPHLHFEIHPGDGKAVDPTAILRAWEHHPDPRAAAWVRRNGETGDQQPGTLVVVRDFIGR